MLLNLIGIKSK